MAAMYSAKMGDEVKKKTERIEGFGDSYGIVLAVSDWVVMP